MCRRRPDLGCVLRRRPFKATRFPGGENPLANMTPAPRPHQSGLSEEGIAGLFDAPPRVAPGQAAVFYGVGEQEGLVLGGGTITEQSLIWAERCGKRWRKQKRP